MKKRDNAREVGEPVRSAGRGSCRWSLVAHETSGGVAVRPRAISVVKSGDGVLCFGMLSGKHSRAAVIVYRARVDRVRAERALTTAGASYRKRRRSRRAARSRAKGAQPSEQRGASNDLFRAESWARPDASIWAGLRASGQLGAPRGDIASLRADRVKHTAPSSRRKPPKSKCPVRRASPT